jgi:hypothetical protein
MRPSFKVDYLTTGRNIYMPAMHVNCCFHILSATTVVIPRSVDMLEYVSLHASIPYSATYNDYGVP